MLARRSHKCLQFLVVHSKEDDTVLEHASDQYLVGYLEYARNPLTSSADVVGQFNQTTFLVIFLCSKKGKTNPSMDDTSCDIPKSGIFIPK